MTMTKEPSMEEILSSIRRVMAQEDLVQRQIRDQLADAANDADQDAAQNATDGSADDTVPGASPVVAKGRAGKASKSRPLRPLASPADDGDVAADDATPARDANVQTDADAALSDAHADANGDANGAGRDEDDILELEEMMTEAPNETPAAPAHSQSVADAAPLASSDTLVASRQSLSALSQAVAKPDTPGDATTVDALVREALKPMLKEWLDANLTGIVESMVAKEIARISGR